MTDGAADLPVTRGAQPLARRRLLALTRSAAFRRGVVLAGLALLWQIAATVAASPLLLPSFTETAAALWDALLHDNLIPVTLASLSVLLKGYLLAIVLAAILVSLAVANSYLREALLTLTAMFNPLPAIALLPLAMLWFGLGETSLIFVLVHSVLWPFALATFTGFQSVPDTHRLVGRSYGLVVHHSDFDVLIPSHSRIGKFSGGR
ncbi:ABC transporter permease, partial [Bradyrhizobium sp. 31Argb]|uniref:ABC transporter permease n=1 Tax=Bradyrhizobium sp. 31Argb TaxID=3141247 RepID=UPI003748B5C0